MKPTWRKIYHSNGKSEVVTENGKPVLDLDEIFKLCYAIKLERARILNEMNRRRELRIEATLAPHIPPKIIRWAKHRRQSLRRAAQRYLERHKFRLEQHPNKLQLYKGDQLLGELKFNYTFKDQLTT